MAGTTDINIAYVNATGQTDFDVVVFTKNFNVNTPKVYYVAWKVLRAQNEADFVFPVSMEVGATYTSSGTTNKAGPFPAELGSTWSIAQEPASATATLTQDLRRAVNPNGSIVVKNTPPTTWGGRMFDVGIYKNGGLLVVQKDVHVGDQVDFMLKPKLYFGVVRNLVQSEVFTSLEITSFLTDFDLSDYPDGLKVTLSQLGAGGQYKFTGDHLTN